MLRTALLASTIVLASAVDAGTISGCDQLDAQMRGVEVRLDDANLRIEGDDLLLRAGGAELIHIDAARNLTVAGRAVAVPPASRADLDAYVAGFRKLSQDAEAIGYEGGRIAGKAVTGLVSVLLTDATLDDLERKLEEHGAKLEAKADGLCRTVAALQRVEQALQQRIPAFPNVISPSNPAL
jgi:hypothetical protein